jgi:hypothetical protein
MNFTGCTFYCLCCDNQIFKTNYQLQRHYRTRIHLLRSTGLSKEDAEKTKKEEISSEVSIRQKNITKIDQIQEKVQYYLI